MLKIAFYTLGCKVNQYETDILKKKAEDAGYIIVNQKEIADIFVINSCSVTNMSDRKTRQLISKVRKIKKDALLVLIGCAVESVSDSDLMKEYNADLIIGNELKLELFNILEEYFKEGYEKRKKCIKKVEDIGSIKKYALGNVLEKGYDVREAIKIEDGCDNFCTYCIIPYLRGRVRSRKKEEIILEVNNLVKNNVSEIVLVAIELASYGKDLQDTSLIDLIYELEKIENLKRIRLGSLLPNFLSEENIILLSKVKKLCPHFHISMQSGDNEVLKHMNRKYTKEDLINISHNIKKYFNDPYIAIDLIVGFNYETDECFVNTVDTIKQMDLSEIHVFKYSKRKYTKAFNMEGEIDSKIKNDRSKQIDKISKNQKEKFLKRQIDKEKEVLFESYKNGINIGLTEDYCKVFLKGNKICGEIKKTKIISLEKEGLVGDVVS